MSKLDHTTLPGVIFIMTAQPVLLHFFLSLYVANKSKTCAQLAALSERLKGAALTAGPVRSRARFLLLWARPPREGTQGVFISADIYSTALQLRAGA